MNSLRLPFDAPEGHAIDRPADADDRAAAVDPRLNVVLEASAGTGKTRVLVDRYVNLLRAGVRPRNILAITFTRKAAAEMRERILTTVRTAAERGELDPRHWARLRAELGEVVISTIDAFCFSLLREFPLEADLDPGFGMADEAESQRLTEEALDRAMRRCRGIATEDEAVGLVFAQLGEWRVRQGMAALLDRRLVAGEALARALRGRSRELTPAGAVEALRERLRVTFSTCPGGPQKFFEAGPVRHPRYQILVADLRRLVLADRADPDRALQSVRLLADELREYFFTKEGTPRRSWSSRYRKEHCVSADAWRRHQADAAGVALRLRDDLNAFGRDLNAVLTRGVGRLFTIALDEYLRTLERHAVVDFTEALSRALTLLGGMDEFALSRYVLEARYHHLLVDEFQDTSDAQWQLVWRLVQSWREGMGISQDAPIAPTIFVVGDRKQSIYGFRDADPAVLARAASRIRELRGETDVRRAIRQNFRAIPPLLAFTNDLCDAIEQRPERTDAFTYTERDRFPVEAAAPPEEPPLGLIAGPDEAACARGVAAEIARLLETSTVRDRQTGVARPARPGDVAILFRSREGHQEYERALERRGIPAYVYKGLGFFDAPEIRDVDALLRFLASPASELRAAALLRSRFLRVSDAGLCVLAGRLSRALVEPQPEDSALDPDDLAVLQVARPSIARWLALADRLPPAEILDLVLRESAYAHELAGPRRQQAFENLKKIRGLIRRLQNRGYATLGRVADQLDRLSAGDESNAVIDALDAVNLMTVHAAKGLEFPIVFLVNLSRGAGGRPDPIRVLVGSDGEPAVSIGDHRSEADEDLSAREREETKRLLYVAVTRARDRLYFSAPVVDGQFRPGSGGFGEVLPAGLATLLADAAGPADRLDWVAAGGTHRFRVCRVVTETDETAVQRTAAEPVMRGDFGVLDLTTPMSVGTFAGASMPDPPRPSSDDEGRSVAPRLVGTLVHRLFEMAAAPDDLEALTARALALTGPRDRAAGVDVEAAAREAARRYQALTRDPALAGRNPAWRELPVSLREGDTILRGAIDAVAVESDGTLAVLELKSGRPRDADGLQLQRYQRALEAITGRSVTGSLVYSPAAPAE